MDPARATLRRARAAARAEAWQTSERLFDEAARLGAAEGRPEVATAAERGLARARVLQGRTTEAIALYRGASRATRDRREAIIARTGVGNAHGLQGRWADAERWYLAAWERCRDGDVRLRGQLYANLSMAAREQGRLADAAAWLDRARATAPRLATDDRSVVHNNEGLLLLARGDDAAALEAFARALELAPGHFDAAMIHDNRVEVELRRGAFDAAERASDAARAEAIASGSARAQCEVLTRRARVLRMSGELDAAAREIDLALERAGHGWFPLAEGGAWHEAARLARAGGDAFGVRQSLETAIQLYLDADAPKLAACARRELSLPAA